MTEFIVNRKSVQVTLEKYQKGQNGRDKSMNSNMKVCSKCSAPKKKIKTKVRANLRYPSEWLSRIEDFQKKRSNHGFEMDY